MAVAAAVERSAAELGLAIPSAGLAKLTAHAEAVFGAERELHLTAPADLETFVARHVAEALQGAALIDPDASGTLLDLGSGNGYPGLALCAVRTGLVPLLAEANQRKATFLDGIVRDVHPDGTVLSAHVQRAADLAPTVRLRVLTTRAMGGWERIVPRLVAALAEDGEVLLWAGADAEAVLRRGVWQRLELAERIALRGRDRSWIYRLVTR